MPRTPRILDGRGRPRTAAPQHWHQVTRSKGRDDVPDGTLIDATPAPGHTFTRDTWPPRGRGRGESLTSPRRIAAKLRAANVIKMRREGYTFQQIADALGFADGSGAYRAMRRAVDRIDWNEYRKRELRRKREAS